MSQRAEDLWIYVFRYIDMTYVARAAKITPSCVYTKVVLTKGTSEKTDMLSEIMTGVIASSQDG